MFIDRPDHDWLPSVSSTIWLAVLFPIVRHGPLPAGARPSLPSPWGPTTRSEFLKSSPLEKSSDPVLIVAARITAEHFVKHRFKKHIQIYRPVDAAAEMCLVGEFS